MKMLTLWACIEPSGDVRHDDPASSALAWKQAWTSMNRLQDATTPATPGEKRTPRQPVT